MTDDTISSQQCAEMLLCSKGHIESLARNGELPALKIGDKWVFVRSDLLSYLAEQARAEAQERKEKRSPKVTPILKAQRRGPPSLAY